MDIFEDFGSVGTDYGDHYSDSEVVKVI